jgi:acyl carrier protein
MFDKDDIIKIIAQQSIVPLNEISTRDPLSSIGIDSLAMVELIISLEDGLNVTFDDSDLDPAQLTTVGAMVDLATKYMRA